VRYPRFRPPHRLELALRRRYVVRRPSPLYLIEWGLDSGHLARQQFGDEWGWFVGGCSTGLDAEMAEVSLEDALVELKRAYQAWLKL